MSSGECLRISDGFPVDAPYHAIPIPLIVFHEVPGVDAMPEDWYASYADLKANEREGVDFRICLVNRASPAVILAPHGGRIESGTSEIAAAIAGDSFSLYCFEGLKPGRAHCELHITSRKFDEPQCMQLVADCRFVIAVHGRKDKKDRSTVYVGGLDTALRDAIAFELMAVGFLARTEDHEFPATLQSNICNKGQRKKGAQLELPKSLRTMLLRNDMRRSEFASAVRLAVNKQE